METSPAKAFQPEQYRSYLHIFARICVRKLGCHLQSKLDASGIVQEALLQAHLALQDFRGNTEPEFTAWLREILQNKLWDQKKYYERGKRDAKLEEALYQTLCDSSVVFANRLDRIVIDQTTPTQHFAKNEKARRLAEGLAALPDDQRTALELHHLQDMSLQETADMMNKTTASVAGLLRRGLAAMRENLRGQEHDLR